MAIVQVTLQEAELFITYRCSKCNSVLKDIRPIPGALAPSTTGLLIFTCMKRCTLIVLFFLLSSITSLFAATVDTVDTYSTSMRKNIKAVVIKPGSYAYGKRFPVVYLLHGYGGNYRDWMRSVPAIAQYADQFQLMIVCPDGNVGSWYLDSPVDPAFKFETYISAELIDWVDKNYLTIASPKARAITGLSMGGHGALYNAFRHQDVFGAAGSMSGGVDIRPFPNNWELSKRLGSYASHPQHWNTHTVVNLTHLLTPNALSIIIDCGVDDFFYGVNQQLHQKLLDTNLPHDFISRPGSHNWTYWSNAVGYQLMYFYQFFKRHGL